MIKLLKPVNLLTPPPAIVSIDPNGDIEFGPGFSWDQEKSVLNVPGEVMNLDIDIIETATQVLTALDQTLTFPTFDSPAWNFTAGVLTPKMMFAGAKLTLECQVNKTGGGTADVQVWGEFTLDGIAWFPVDNSLRRFAFDKDGPGNISFTAAGAVPLGPPVQFRLRMKNVGGGTVSLAAPTGTTDGAVPITSFSKKLSIG